MTDSQAALNALESVEIRSKQLKKGWTPWLNTKYAFVGQTDTKTRRKCGEIVSLNLENDTPLHLILRGSTPRYHPFKTHILEQRDIAEMYIRMILEFCRKIGLIKEKSSV